MPGQFKRIFDGQSLVGWHAVPRRLAPIKPGGPQWDVTPERLAAIMAHTGRWTVEEGAICGRQEPAGSGLGAYLLSDEVYGDYELVFEAKPDWPADTGVVLRATDIGSQGFQVLMDHRKSGNIGGYYGNGIGGFHAINFALDVARDAAGRPTGLQLEDPATTIEPLTPLKRSLLSYAASGEDFLKVWHWGDWNEFRISIKGEVPVLSTTINGVKIAELDVSTLPADLFDRQGVAALLGRHGRIALEVHDNDPIVGGDRWGYDAASRWRNLQIREF